MDNALNVCCMISIFSVPLSRVTKENFLSNSNEALRAGEAVSISTVNPEILLRAKRSPAFADTLRACSWRVIDGFGISLVSFLKYRTWLPRITGATAVELLISLAEQHSFSVGIVGGKPGRSARAMKYLKSKYQHVRFFDLLDGGDCTVDLRGHITSGGEVLDKAMMTKKPNILLVAFGAEKQEAFILRFFKKYPFLRMGIGIGGLVDVWSGNVKSPPHFFSMFGLEWLWRLIQEPKRFTRILNAVIVFPIQAIFLDKHV